MGKDVNVCEKKKKKVPDFMIKCLNQFLRNVILPFVELTWKRLLFDVMAPFCHFIVTW